MAEPILKWAGGKRQLLDELYARFPTEYDRYHEPFAEETVRSRDVDCYYYQRRARPRVTNRIR